MKIPLPNKLLDHIERWYRPVGDWLNVDVYRRIRRIDLLIVILGITFVAFYWYVWGWQQALLGGLMFVLAVMLALWFF